MFFDILYFFSMTGFCVTTTGALLYIYDKDLATKIAYSIGQYGLNACAYTLDFVENIEKRDVSEDSVILYNYGKTTIIESSLLYENDVKNKDLVIFIINRKAFKNNGAKPFSEKRCPNYETLKVYRELNNFIFYRDTSLSASNFDRFL